MNIPEFKLERYFAKYEFCTRYLMCSSDPESWSTHEILAFEPGSEQAYLNLKLGYTPSEGSPGLRTEVARIYSTIDPDEVLMFAGAEEGIFCFANALLGPGDHIIVHTPCYQSHKEIAASIGVNVTCWEAREADRWELDADEVTSLVRPETKAILINSPHNPTGALIRRATFDAINDLCLRRGIVLFSDEVFRESELDSAKRLPAACDVNPQAVSLGVTSKTYGLPGLRIGWIATHNAPLRAKMAALKDYTTICNSRPSEFLAEIAMRHRARLAERTVGLLRSNLALFDAFLIRQADWFSWIRPEGSPMGFPKLLQGDVDSFCDRAVREAGVFLLPGSVYADAGNHFRIGFGRQNFPEALNALENWVGKIAPAATY